MNTSMGKLLLAAGAWLAATSVFATEIVVIVNPKNPATRMFSEQAGQFFVGKSTLFTPVEHTDGPLRTEFYRKVLDKDTAQVKAIWSKLVFTGKATAPKELGSSAEVKKAVAADPNAIGYIEKSAADDTVKVILTIP
ncbi:ABC-type phosphate transport system substrate-binding protein [Duganella sp. SG902]|nr:ABC-type phosphate transport system substrate-binding protein [Duganella sp. SG902]